MGDLTLAAAVDPGLAAATLLKLHLACRLVQLVELTGGVGASDELPGQQHVHPVVHSQGKLRYSPTLIEAALDEEVYERALTCITDVGMLKASVQPDPRGNIVH